LIILLIKGSKGGINFIDSIKQTLYLGSFISDEVKLFAAFKSKASFIELGLVKNFIFPKFSTWSK